MKTFRFTNFAAAVLLGISVGVPVSAPADDTEIYTGDNIAEGIKPNVLIILDTSGSMDGLDGGTVDRLQRMKDALYSLLDNVDNVNIGLMRFTNPGGPVLFPVAEVDADADLIAQAGQPDVTVRISDNADDAEELLTNIKALSGPARIGDVKLDSVYLDLLDSAAFGTELPLIEQVSSTADDAEQGKNFRYSRGGTVLQSVFDPGSSYGIQTNGFRFSNVETANRDTDDATVLFASLSLTSLDDRSGPLDFKIFGLYAGDMDSFSTSISSSCPGGFAGDIYCRLGLTTTAQRTAGLDFSNVESFSHGTPPSAPPGNITNSTIIWKDVPATTRREEIHSPDIGPILTEIFSHPGWQTSDGTDDLGIFFTGTTASRREFYTRDSSTSRAARLTGHYVKKGNPAGKQIVALRFQGVRVPQGAVIKSAELELAAVGEGDDAVTINILGEKVGDAPAFTAITAGVPATPALRLSARRASNPTTAVVSWPLTASDKWTHESPVQTPDITTVIKEIVDQPGTSGWCGGNDLVIFLEYATVPGTPSDRHVFAHDADPSLAPILKIDYDKDTFPAGTGCTVETITRQVSADKDDAEETVSSGNVSTTGQTMQMIKSGSSRQTNGVIFRDIEVHPGASTKILSATVDFVAKASASANATSVTVTGQNSDDILRFEPATNDVSSRTVTNPTTNTASFSFPATSVNSNDSVATPDLSPIITEITTRTGWQSGNDIALVFTGSTGQVDFYTHDDDASKAARLRLTVQYKISEVTTTATVVTVRSRLKEIIADLTHDGSTPIVDTLYEAALYFRGESVLYGAARGAGFRGAAANERNTRLSHPGSYKRPPGRVVYPLGCNMDDSNLSSDACRGQTIQNSPEYITPIKQACQANFIVLLTDGSANNNHSTDEIKTMTGVTNCQAQLSNGVNAASGESCGVDLVKFLSDVNKDQGKNVSGKQQVKTYTIGFNISTQFLKDLASAGDGQYYEASSSSGLATVFQAIITDVLSQTTSFAAPSLSVNAFNRLEDRNEVYFSLFEPSQKARWDGNIKKFQLCQKSTDDCVTLSGAEVGDVLDARSPPLEAVDTNGRILDSALSFWTVTPDGPNVLLGGAGADVIKRGYAARRVFTFVDQASQTTTQPSGTVTFYPSSRDLGESKNILIDSGGDGVLDNLTAADGNAVQRLAQTRELLGLGGATLLEIQEQLEWIQGKDVDGLFDDAKFGANRWTFGDPLHGNPLALTYGGVATDPIVKLLAGTNDGGIRLINSNSGQEEWTFFPPSMLPLQNVLRVNPSNGKRYGIDGSATPWIRDSGDATGNKVGVIEPAKGDFIRVFIGQRRGGDQYWGLDISPTTEIATNQQTLLGKVNPKLMWRIRGGTNEFPLLGETWSRPFLTTMQVGTTTAGEAVRRTVLIFAGGYEESTQDSGFQVATSRGNAIYVVDAATGERLFFIGGPGATARHITSTQSPDIIGVDVPGMVYPIPSDVSAFDSDGDGATDRVYVGDNGGQMWRVDFSPNRGAAAGLKGVVGKLAAVSSASADADKRKFFYAPSIIQVRGAGSEADEDYDLISAVTGIRNNPLNTTVEDRFFAFRDYTLDTFIDSNSDGLADGYTTIRGDLDGGPADTPPATTYGDMTDLSTVSDLDNLTAAARNSFTAGSGYYLRLNEGPGEKGLAAPITIAGKLFFTTYLPQGVVSSTECTLAEGRGLLYGFDAISGEAIFNWDLSTPDPNNLTYGDRTHKLGSGIPSNPVPVFFPEKVMLLIGVGGGAEAVDPEITVPKGRTYWLQQQ